MKGRVGLRAGEGRRRDVAKGWRVKKAAAPQCEPEAVCTDHSVALSHVCVKSTTEGNTLP